MANIRTALKNAKRVLFSDSEYFNKDITGARNIEEIKRMFQIKGNVYRKDDYGNQVLYKVAEGRYDFTCTIIN